jgi:hypothetical protein
MAVTVPECTVCNPVQIIVFNKIIFFPNAVSVSLLSYWFPVYKFENAVLTF